MPFETSQIYQIARWLVEQVQNHSTHDLCGIGAILDSKGALILADDHIHDLNRFFEHIEAWFDEVIKRIAALEERVEHLENTIQAGSDMHRREIVALRADFCALTKGIYKLPVGVR